MAEAYFNRQTGRISGWYWVLTILLGIVGAGIASVIAAIQLKPGWWKFLPLGFAISTIEFVLALVILFVTGWWWSTTPPVPPDLINSIRSIPSQIGGDKYLEVANVFDDRKYKVFQVWLSIDYQYYQTELAKNPDASLGFAKTWTEAVAEIADEKLKSQRFERVLYVWASVDFPGDGTRILGSAGFDPEIGTFIFNKR